MSEMKTLVNFKISFDRLSKGRALIFYPWDAKQEILTGWRLITIKRKI